MSLFNFIKKQLISSLNGKEIKEQSKIKKVRNYYILMKNMKI